MAMMMAADDVMMMSVSVALRRAAYMQVSRVDPTLTPRHLSQPGIKPGPPRPGIKMLFARLCNPTIKHAHGLDRGAITLVRVT